MLPEVTEKENEHAKQPNSWLEQTLERATKAKEGAIGVLALVYAFGYLAWSLNAWQNSLGLVAGWNAQYFAAGLPPFLFAVTCAFATRYLWQREVKAARLVAEGKRQSWNPWSWTLWWGVVLTLIAYQGYHASSRLRNDGGWIDPPIVGAFSLLVLVVAVMFLRVYAGELLRSAPNDLAGFDSKTKRVLPTMVLVVLLPGCIALYDSSYFPNLPEEFGGAKPRLAYLDLKVEDLSDDTMDVLLGPGVHPTTGTAGSVLVRLYYVSNEKYIVSPVHAQTEIDGPIGLAASSVTSIRYTHDDTP